MTRTATVASALVLAAAAVLIVLAVRSDDTSPTSAQATAPLAPQGVPGVALCATDPPGTGRTEMEEAETVQLPAPDPGRQPPGSPDRALAEFLDAWHDRAWDRMAQWTSPSWRRIVPGDEGRLLRQRYGTYRLRGWAPTPGEREAGLARFTVLTAYRDLRPAVVRERLRFVVTRESVSGRPVESGGRWGVFLATNPDPAARCPRPAGAQP